MTTENTQRELERLRGEVSELKGRLADAEAEAQTQSRAAAAARETAGPPPGGPARRRLGWRGPVTSLLIILGCVLAPISVIGVWTANQVGNTDRYVANVSPLITQPAIRGALTDRISTAVSKQIDVQRLTKQVATQLDHQGLTRLGGLLSNFSGSIASGVDGFIHSTVAKIVASPAAQRLWVQGNRLVHQQLVLALEGKNSSVTVSDGKVVIGLAPLINQVKHDLAARGLTIVSKIPPINPTFPLFSAKYLVKAQSLYRLLNTLKWALPIIALLCLAAGVYIARRHRRALIGAGLGLAASMVVLGIALGIIRTVYLNKLPVAVNAEAAAAAFDTLVRFIRQGLRVLLAVGLVVAIAAFFTGPSITAVRTREAFKSGFGSIRGTADRAGITTGPVGSWVYQHRTPLRITAVAIAALVLLFGGIPTGLTVLVIAIILVLVLGLIELIGRPPAQART
ncbi:MAG TPA: hypothetical protein VFI65_02145 [Streptosporangiaceae bacterium]|nr:hypothetical protein [Streptosporangiaceae bacterium]